MGNLFMVGGLVYAAAILVQVLSYNSCQKKSELERPEGLEGHGAMAGHGCR